MASLSLADGRSLISLLKCPVCLLVMKPPIFICQNGHSYCGVCRPGLFKCPTCRGQLSNTRNLLAEDFAFKMRYPCRNKVRGCRKKVSLEDMKKHESNCPHRLYECLVAKEKGCNWIGCRSEILRHTQIEHDAYVYKSDLCKFGFENFDFLQEHKFSCLLYFAREIFLYSSERDPASRKLYDVIQYIGPTENASKFAYEHRFMSPSCDQQLKFTNVVKRITDEIHDICEKRKCFIIDYDTLRMFIKNSAALEYQIKMLKQK
jgi:E3 ubiquitin-protein ligase SIAH1